MPLSKKFYLFRKLVKNANGDQNRIYPSLTLQTANFSLLKGFFKIRDVGQKILKSKFAKNLSRKTVSLPLWPFFTPLRAGIDKVDPRNTSFSSDHIYSFSHGAVTIWIIDLQ